MLGDEAVDPATWATTRGMGETMASSPDFPRRNNGQTISSDCADGEVRGHAADGAFRAPAEDELSLANELVLERLLARSARIVMVETQP